MKKWARGSNALRFLGMFEVRRTSPQWPDCWVWQRGKWQAGYACFNRNASVRVYGHRWAYEQIRGPILHGIDHLCSVRACVNPWHMEDVGKAENTRRGARKYWDSISDVEKARRVSVMRAGLVK